MGKGIALSLQAGAGGAASDVEGVDMVSMVYGTQPVTMCPKGNSCSVLTYTLACSCPCESILKLTSELPAIANANHLHISVMGECHLTLLMMALRQFLQQLFADTGGTLLASSDDGQNVPPKQYHWGI